MFRLPNITGKTDSEKISQITDYLFQLVRELDIKTAALDELIEKSKE